MKNKSHSNIRWMALLFLGALLLLIPLIAMQFSSEVNWSLSDFLLMGFMLFTFISCFELILRKVKSPKSRYLFLGFSVALFLLIWAELAVGIFKSPIAGS
jgi:hypothetical protein